jgi:hypothetical protein
MGRPKKIKDDNIINSTINHPETEDVSGKVLITSLKGNFKFSIFWLDHNKQRQFNLDVFNKHKELCRHFNEMVKKGWLKIEYR